MDFRYQATNARGETITGRIEAQSEREAARLLRQQDLTPLNIAMPAAKRNGGRRRIRHQDKVLVMREMTTLLASGVPLAEAVESIAEAHDDSPLGGIFSTVHQQLRQGIDLSAALTHPDFSLPPYVRQLVAAGEMTGKLAAAMETAAVQMEHEERVRQEMRNALTYPAILVFTGIAATLLVFILVVPKFANLIKSGHADIPAISKWVIGAGLFVQQHLLAVTLIGMGIVALTLIALTNPRIRSKAYQTLAQLPILGEWLREQEMGRWASLLGALLQNRVPLVAALELAQQGQRIAVLRTRLQQSLREVRAGKGLAQALAGTQALEATGINLIRVGERSGELAPMLNALAGLYQESGRNRMKRFLLLLEPIAILLIGGVIGGIMIAIMLAITSLNTVSF